MSYRSNILNLWKDAPGARSGGSLQVYNRLEEIHMNYLNELDKKKSLAGLFNGLIKLVRSEFEPSQLKLHTKLFTCLICLSYDFFELGKENKQYSVLGCFYDLKFNKHWQTKDFYQMMGKAFDYVVKSGSFFTQEVSEKIMGQYREKFPDEFQIYVAA